MSLYWTLVFFASLRDLVTIADAVADWTRPGRHRARYSAGHAIVRVR